MPIKALDSVVSRASVRRERCEGARARPGTTLNPSASPMRALVPPRRGPRMPPPEAPCAPRASAYKPQLAYASGRGGRASRGAVSEDTQITVAAIEQRSAIKVTVRHYRRRCTPFLVLESVHLRAPISRGAVWSHVLYSAKNVECAMGACLALRDWSLVLHLCRTTPFHNAHPFHFPCKVLWQARELE